MELFNVFENCFGIYCIALREVLSYFLENILADFFPIIFTLPWSIVTHFLNAVCSSGASGGPRAGHGGAHVTGGASCAGRLESGERRPGGHIANLKKIARYENCHRLHS